MTSNESQLINALRCTDNRLAAHNVEIPTLDTIERCVAARRHTRQIRAGIAVSCVAAATLLATYTNFSDQTQRAGAEATTAGAPDPIEAAAAIASLRESIEQLGIAEVSDANDSTVASIRDRIDGWKSRRMLAESRDYVQTLEAEMATIHEPIVSRSALAAVRLEIAETYEQYGETSLALSSYRNLATTDAESPWGEIAADRVAAITK